MLDSLPDVAGLKEREALEPGYMRALLDAAESIGWDQERADYLAAVVSFESGHRPDARNPLSDASGLIQWLPSTSPVQPVAALRQMTAIAQLPLVASHFGARPVAPRDIYMRVFYPAAAGKSDAHVLFESPSLAYRQNQGLDASKKGYVTAGDARGQIDRRLAIARVKPRIAVPAGSGGAARTAVGVAMFAGVVLVGVHGRKQGWW